MDSITQFVLGAAIGEAIAGKKIGNKAILWGGIAGTIPDLDVILSPFLDEVQRLTIHRSITHSLLFAFVFAPLLAYLLHRYYRSEKASFRDWTLLLFWGIFTHPLLDACTTYGTQLFAPFSDYRVGLNNIFIVDFFYTLPLLIGVIICLFLSRSSVKRRYINTAALLLSTGYLALSLFNKQIIDKQFERAFAEQHISYKRYLTGVTPLNIFLWYAVAETETGYYMGYRSLFDKTSSVELVYIPRNEQLIADIKDDYAIDRLLWFCKDYYSVRERDGKLYLYDLKFGMSGVDPKEEKFVFYFELYKDPISGEGKWHELFNRDEVKMGEAFKQMWTRIKGV